MKLYESNVRDDLPALPDFCQLSERVWRVMGLNPGKFTLQGTNTYLVGSGARKVLIDCGDGQPGYVPLLVQSLSSMGAYISDILISHCHKDHWGGLDGLMSSELAQQQEIKIHKFPLSEEYPMQKYFGMIPESILTDDLNDQQMIEVDKETHLRVVYTPGHAKDHCSFHLTEENSIFTADCVLGHGTVTFEDLTEYMKSLYRIHQLKPTRLYPGHGDVVKNGLERVENYIAIRMAKEKQILELMKDGLGWSAIELAETMAEPTKNYHEDLAAVLVRTAGLHLIKLYHDGKVELEQKTKLESKYGEFLYDPHNIFSIVNHKWKLSIHSKL